MFSMAATPWQNEICTFSLWSRASFPCTTLHFTTDHTFLPNIWVHWMFFFSSSYTAIKSLFLFAFCTTFWYTVPNAPWSIFTVSSLFWSPFEGYLFAVQSAVCISLSKFHHFISVTLLTSIYPFLWLTKIKTHRYIAK